MNATTSAYRHLPASTLASFSTKGLGSQEDSLIETETVASALFFLCSINADATEVEHFLGRFPESRLFDETNRVANIENLLLEQKRKCTCFGADCNTNRMKILKLLKDHKWMLSRSRATDPHFRNMTSESSSLDAYTLQLRSLECELGKVNGKIDSIQLKVAEMQAEGRRCRMELEEMSKQEIKNRSSLALIACQRNKAIGRRLQLENAVVVAALNVTSLEQEQQTLLQERMTVNRLKTTLLKSAFAGCRRHVCDASKMTSHF